MADPVLPPEPLRDPEETAVYLGPLQSGTPTGSGEWALIRYVGEPIGEVLPFHGAGLTLGRSTDNDVCLADPEVSRCHARLRLEAGPEGALQVRVSDLGSTNGTFVNGRRLERGESDHPLQDGDVVRVGMHAFKLKHLDGLERQYHEALRLQTTRDALTGVSNRATVLHFLEKQSELARRHGRPFSLILCDLDHFKEINDTLGHPAGDLVLKRFGDLLGRRLRGSDHVGRIGGEEFLVVLPETAGREAMSVAEALRKALAKERIRIGEGLPPCSVTASFGVAELAEGDASVGSLLARADVALYRAKRAGRNRVEFDPTP